VTYQTGDRVEYTAAPVFDQIITTGEVGIVTTVESEWICAIWPRSGQHSVPVANVRLAYKIETTETSNGAYHLSGCDAMGRSVQLSGEDPDALADRVVDWLDEQNGVARP
jgi:hypothetical protein